MDRRFATLSLARRHQYLLAIVRSPAPLQSAEREAKLTKWHIELELDSGPTPGVSAGTVVVTLSLAVGPFYLLT